MLGGTQTRVKAGQRQVYNTASQVLTVGVRLLPIPSEANALSRHKRETA
jgi:hypothetical protein